MNLLEGHRAAVTGGASGIGRAIALGYAEQGAEVVVLDIDGGAAGAVRDEIAGAGHAAHAFELDVRDRAACAAAAGRIAREIGPVSILVNNAGINRRNPFAGDAGTVAGDWDDIMAVNLDGVFNVTRAFLDQLRANRGRVVNIGSIQSFLHVRTPNSIAYTTSRTYGANSLINGRFFSHILQPGKRLRNLCFPGCNRNRENVHAQGHPDRQTNRGAPPAQGRLRHP